MRENKQLIAQWNSILLRIELQSVILYVYKSHS